jgi:hypothetical protein
MPRRADNRRESNECFKLSRKMRNSKKENAVSSAIQRLDALRDANYRCITCQAQNHKKGYYNEAGAFIACDPHMLNWALKQGLKIVTIHLQVVFKDLDKTNIRKENITVMCLKHRLSYIHEIKRWAKLSPVTKP